MPKKAKKRNRRLTMEEKRTLLQKLDGKLTPDELEYLNTLVNRQIEQAKQQATAEAISTVYGVVFRVLLDKFDFRLPQLHSLWEKCEEYGRLLASGEVPKRDLLLSLAEEDNVVITDEDGEE